MAAVAMLATTAYTVLIAGPAEAAISSQVFSKTSENSRLVLKEVSIDCPASRPRILGGGGEILPRTANATLAKLRPIKGPSTDRIVVRAVAMEGNPEPFDWQLTGYAVCGPDLPGHVIAYADAAEPPGRLQSAVTLGCPGDGKAPIGVGGEIRGGGQDRASFRMIAPTANPFTRVRVIAQDDEVNGLPIAPDFSVRAYLICVNRRPVHVDITGDEVTGEDAPVSTSVTCPIAGSEVHAMGMIREDRYGFAHLTGIVPSATDRRKYTVYAARPGPLNDFAPPWTLDTMAVCAT